MSTIVAPTNRLIPILQAEKAKANFSIYMDRIAQVGYQEIMKKTIGANVFSIHEIMDQDKTASDDDSDE